MTPSLVDVVHIGFPKTGTTFLQAEVIPRLENVVSVGRGRSLLDPRYLALANQLASADPFEFSVSAFRTQYADLHRELGVGTKIRGVRFLSHEHLCGELYGGWRMYQLIERIHSVFGKVKVLITIREQRKMIESVYRHYVFSGGGLDIRELLYKRTSPGVDLWGNRDLLSRFQYDRVLARCHELFGAEQVKVIPLEYLKVDAPRFVREICEFVGVPEPAGVTWSSVRRNDSLSYGGTWVLRYMNQLVSTPLSDTPWLRLVPKMQTRFLTGVYRPVDQVLLSKLFHRRSFINKTKTWRLRRTAKRLLIGFRRAAGRGQCPIEPGFLNDVIRYLDWPETDRMLHGGHLSWDRDIDLRRIDRDIDLYYADSNRRTASLTGYDLGELGYAVGTNVDGDGDRGSAL